MSAIEKLEDLLEAPLFQEGDIVEILNLPNSCGYVANIYNYGLPTRRIIKKVLKTRVKGKIMFNYTIDYIRGEQLSFFTDSIITQDYNWVLEEKYLHLIKRG